LRILTLHIIGFVGICSDDELEYFEGVWVVRRGSSYSEDVARREFDVRGFETEGAVYFNFECGGCLTDLNFRWNTAIAVRIGAVTERERVDRVVRGVLDRTIVEETTNISTLISVSKCIEGR
jgi:hypothetical protein